MQFVLSIESGTVFQIEQSGISTRSSELIRFPVPDDRQLWINSISAYTEIRATLTNQRFFLVNSLRSRVKFLGSPAGAATPKSGSKEIYPVISSTNSYTNGVNPSTNITPGDLEILASKIDVPMQCSSNSFLIETTLYADMVLIETPLVANDNIVYSSKYFIDFDYRPKLK